MNCMILIIHLSNICVCVCNFYLNKLFKLHIHSLKIDYHDNQNSYQAYTKYV